MDSIDNPMMLKILATCVTLVISLSLKAGIIDFDLKKIDEDKLLGPLKEARLLPLEDSEQPFNDEKPPLILVHGIKSNPSDLQAIVDRFKHSQYQLYVLAYDDFHTRTSKNGTYLSSEIDKLGKKNITIVAHSMGGIVSRKAIADLVEKKSISDYESIRLFTIDTPWHGFDGPSDDNFQMKFVIRFMPEGLLDMRAKSNFFKELNRVAFPPNVSIDIVFAKEGLQAKDYTENINDPVAKYNFDSALKLTKKVTDESSDLEKNFPRFKGNHSSVIKDKEFLDYLEAKIIETEF